MRAIIDSYLIDYKIPYSVSYGYFKGKQPRNKAVIGLLHHRSPSKARSRVSIATVTTKSLVQENTLLNRASHMLNSLNEKLIMKKASYFRAASHKKGAVGDRFSSDYFVLACIVEKRKNRRSTAEVSDVYPRCMVVGHDWSPHSEL